MLMRIMANPNGNYLRARGEYVAHLAAKSGIAELPPRTRRILWCFRFACVVCGTTSAHAENTPPAGCYHSRTRNYLRARGEYLMSMTAARRMAELPPRTRRILQVRSGARFEARTTSAHAENTNANTCVGHSNVNYLRARGEYIQRCYHTKHLGELPPRTRRILEVKRPVREKPGTTSAHAENTFSPQ